jgi:hypothetical protein
MRLRSQLAERQREDQDGNRRTIANSAWVGSTATHCSPCP